MPMCFIACGGDDESSESGLTRSRLIGDWTVIESGNGRDDGDNADVGDIWSFNSDGSFSIQNHTSSRIKWEISGNKILFTRTSGKVEAYSAEIKDGKLYTNYDREWDVLIRYNETKE